MKSGLLSLFGAAMLVGLFTAGCGGDDTTIVSAAALTPSQLGESCTRTADCSPGLVCVGNYCVQSSAPVEGGTTPPAAGPVLGEKGDSCTKRADCKTGLACIQQTCTEGATPVTPDGGTVNPDGGTVTPTGPRLGDRGETCTVVADCKEGLTCVPQSFGFGVCDVQSYGLTPTGNTCSGECKTATDCCELPVGLVAGVRSCEDIVHLLGDSVATACAAPVPFANQPYCFYYTTYCVCAADAWTCTNSQCSYTAACQNSGAVPAGCPSRTRSASSANLNSTCTSNKCGAVASVCTTAAECTTLTPVVDGNGELCSPGECTCYQKACYRQCKKDLDCPQYYSCDQTSKVCVPGARCQKDAECAKTTGDVRAKCNAQGACEVPCTTDHQCDQSGLGTGLFGSSGYQVCSPTTHTCQPIGCASDTECATSAGVKLFCVAPTAAAAGAAVSAITN